MQFGLPASAQRYLKYFQPLKIIALLEIYQVLVTTLQPQDMV
jgi:hypothetical protein